MNITMRAAGLLAGVGIAVLTASCSSGGNQAPASSTAPSTVRASVSMTPVSETPSPTESAPPSGTESPTATTGETTSTSPLPPAPADSTTMKCSKFITLDEATQEAVAKEILSGGKSMIPAENYSLGATIAKGICVYKPDTTVASALGAE